MSAEERAKLKPLALKLAVEFCGYGEIPTVEEMKAIDALAESLLDHLDLIEAIA